MLIIRQTEVFSTWLGELKDRQARLRILVRLDRLALGNAGDVKPVGQGVSELRIDYGGGFGELVMTTKLKPYDSAEYLRSEADMADYLNACLEEGDAALTAHAIGVVARARGMTQIAKDTNLGRESLYKALSVDGNPSFATMLKVIEALGMKLTVRPQQ